MEDYKQGCLFTPKEHSTLLPLALMNAEEYIPTERYYIKIMGEDEARTLGQNNTFWKVLSIVRRLGTITKINQKGQEVPKNEEEILVECMYNLKHLDKMILGYRYVKDGKICKTTKDEIASLGTDKEPVRNTTTKIGKRRFSELIKYVLDYCDANISNMSNPDHAEYSKLRDDLTNNSIRR